MRRDRKRKKERREKVNGFFATKEEKAGGKKKEKISSFFPFSMPLGHFYVTLRGWCDKKRRGEGSRRKSFLGIQGGEETKVISLRIRTMHIRGNGKYSFGIVKNERNVCGISYFDGFFIPFDVERLFSL